MRYGLITLAAAGLLLCAAPSASAQSDAYMRLMRTQNQQMMNRVRIYSSVRSGARITRYRGAGKTSGGTAKGTPGSKRTAPPASGGSASPQGGSTTFRPVADSIMPHVMAQEVARTPDERPRLEKLFGEMLENYRSRLRGAGGPQTDVSRAATYLISASHDAYFDSEPLSQEEFDALREHMREVYATDAKFQRASDRERQEMFETFGIVATWIDAGFQTAKRAGDREGMRHWRGMARANLENMLGAPPEQVAFTRNGIMYR
ncbi:MAG TPA: DUF6683 family protein [Pyrinomonadaceae bacterium]|jgi:hypothetical protein|nr:DUF6683 family protein [Pyrinomonadaceae bacterium]